MSQQSTAGYAIVPSSTPPRSGCPARVGPCPPGGGTQGDRWGRIRRYPVQIASSIVVVFVSLIIMIMLLALNEGARSSCTTTKCRIIPPGWVFRVSGVSVLLSGFGDFDVSTFQRSLNRGSGAACPRLRRSRSWGMIIFWICQISELFRFSGKLSDAGRIGRHRILELLRRVDRLIGRSMCIWMSEVSGLNCITYMSG